MRVYRPVPAAPGGHVAPPSYDGELRHVGVIDDNLDPVLMDGLVTGLRSHLPGVRVEMCVKPVGTAPAPAALVDQMAAAHQAAVTGIGM